MLPRIVQEENNPEVLKAFLEHTIKVINDQSKTIKKLGIEKATKDQETLKLDDQLLVLRKRMFGKSSEKRGASRLRSKGKKQLSLHGASLAPAPSKKELGQLQEINVEHKMSAEELAKIATEYGYPEDSEWECLTSFYDESEEVDIKVESYVRKKHRRFKYRLKASRGSEKEIIVTAPAPVKIMPGAKYSVEFAVEVVTKKYLYHLPLERIRRQMESGGLAIAVKTLYSLCFFIHCYLEDLAQKIKQEIMLCGLSLHIDETKWPINNKKQSDGYMWVVSNQAGSYYQFEPTRSGKVAKELVGSYRGPVVTDGYGGYKSQYTKMEGIKLAFCWAHVRRKYSDIEQNYPKECKEILDLLEELFHIERIAKDYENLKSLRQTRSQALIDKIKSWLLENQPKARAEGHLLGAINYTMNHWSGLTLFLEDVRIPLSNNEVERTIRHSVMGRKNFYGSRTINGADVAATLYTIIESCKKVELDPKTYILIAVKKAIAGEQALTPLEYAKSTRQGLAEV